MVRKDNPSIILNIEDLDLDMSKTISDNENKLYQACKVRIGFIKGKNWIFHFKFI